MKPSCGPSLDFLLRSGSITVSLVAASDCDAGMTGTSAGLCGAGVFLRVNGRGRFDRNLDMGDGERVWPPLASPSSRSWSGLQHMHW